MSKNKARNNKHKKKKKKESAVMKGTKVVAKALGKAAWSGFKAGTKQVNSHREDFNFMKAPKDSPSDLKIKVLTETEPIPEIPESIKKLFKFW